jgi:hypothetical protein
MFSLGDNRDNGEHQRDTLPDAAVAEAPAVLPSTRRSTVDDREGGRPNRSLSQCATTEGDVISSYILSPNRPTKAWSGKEGIDSSVDVAPTVAGRDSPNIGGFADALEEPPEHNSPLQRELQLLQQQQQQQQQQQRQQDHEQQGLDDDTAGDPAQHRWSQSPVPAVPSPRRGGGSVASTRGPAPSDGGSTRLARKNEERRREIRAVTDRLSGIDSAASGLEDLYSSPGPGGAGDGSSTSAANSSIRSAGSSARGGSGVGNGGSGNGGGRGGGGGGLGTPGLSPIDMLHPAALRARARARGSPSGSPRARVDASPAAAQPTPADDRKDIDGQDRGQNGQYGSAQQQSQQQEYQHDQYTGQQQQQQQQQYSQQQQHYSQQQQQQQQYNQQQQQYNQQYSPQQQYDHQPYVTGLHPWGLDAGRQVAGAAGSDAEADTDRTDPGSASSPRSPHVVTFDAPPPPASQTLVARLAELSPSPPEPTLRLLDANHRALRELFRDYCVHGTGALDR